MGNWAVRVSVPEPLEQARPLIGFGALAAKGL